MHVNLAQRPEDIPGDSVLTVLTAEVLSLARPHCCEYTIIAINDEIIAEIICDPHAAW
jgi:hypothetical protein